jgi:hypothetical protein
MPNRTAVARRKPRQRPSGRLPSLRLFSTQLALTLKTKVNERNRLISPIDGDRLFAREARILVI